MCFLMLILLVILLKATKTYTKLFPFPTGETNKSSEQNPQPPPLDEQVAPSDYKPKKDDSVHIATVNEKDPANGCEGTVVETRGSRYFVRYTLDGELKGKCFRKSELIPMQLL